MCEGSRYHMGCAPAGKADTTDKEDEASICSPQKQQGGGKTAASFAHLDVDDAISRRLADGENADISLVRRST
ncbi:hypothetical protein FGB62_31g05 [Gracilaria domingensis]|nr:hypothetical protein FGB62_31g05 [Gracilaria domingensis]